MFGLWKIRVRKYCQGAIDVFNWQMGKFFISGNELQARIEHPKSLGYIAGYLKTYLEHIDTLDNTHALYALEFTYKSVFGEQRGGACFDKFIFFFKTSNPDLLLGLNNGRESFQNWKNGNISAVEDWRHLINSIRA